MEGKWLPNSLMKWDMFVFGQCILAPVQRKKMSSQISLRRGLKKKGETTNCSTKLLDLTKPFHLQSQAGSQNYSYSHPTPHPWRENGQCLLPEIIPVSVRTRHEWYSFPGREWEAAAGWHCFSLTNATVTHRSHSVSCVLQTSAKGRLQWTPALLFLPQTWRDVLVN